MAEKNEKRSFRNKPKCDNYPFLRCQAGACCTSCRKPIKKGVAAHIYGWAKGSPRHAPNADKRFFTENKYFLYLCTECHSKIDDHEKIWTSERLLQEKAKHIEWVESRGPAKTMDKDRKKDEANEKLINLIHEEWKGDYESLEVQHLDPESEVELYIKTSAWRGEKTRILALAIESGPVDKSHKEAQSTNKDIIGYNYGYIVLLSPNSAIWKIYPRQFWNFVPIGTFPTTFCRGGMEDNIAIAIEANKEYTEVKIRKLIGREYELVIGYFDDDEHW
jgi:hypothetical protein